MNNTIENSKFYNTFTTFISAKTKSAEKTIAEQNFNTVTDKKSNKELRQYALAGGFLLIPIFVLIASKSHIDKMLSSLDKEYFLAVNNRIPGGFLNGVAKRVRLTKHAFVNGLATITEPLRTAKDDFFLKAYQQDSTSNTFFNRSIKNINAFFKNQKLYAFSRQDKKLKNMFSNLEKNLIAQCKIIESSADGKVKILFPTKIRSNATEELPKIVDFSKTCDGKNRAEEIRKLLQEIHGMLNKETSCYSNYLEKITYSCEDIFADANKILLNIFKEGKGKTPKSKEIRSIIKDIYDDLIRYRYGEILKDGKVDITQGVREIHLKNITKKLSTLKEKANSNPVIVSYIENFEQLIQKAENPENMGLLERIRMLLKCNDVKSNLVIDSTKPSLFKHYQPDEYIKTKKLISDFAKELKFAKEREVDLLPTAFDEINRGKIFTHALSVAAPGSILLGNSILSTSSDDKKRNKRNLFSFLTGSLIMVATHNFAVWSRTKSIIWGIVGALGTAKLYDKIKD